MGCDYYTQIILRIEYNKDGEKKVYDDEEERQPHYIWSGGDPDFEVPRNELEDTCSAYGTKVFYENRVWKCLAYGKERVLEICREQGIPEESLVYVYKFKTGWWR